MSYGLGVLGGLAPETRTTRWRSGQQYEPVLVIKTYRVQVSGNLARVTYAKGAPALGKS
jgi:hypothetical protein